MDNAVELAAVAGFWVAFVVALTVKFDRAAAFEDVPEISFEVLTIVDGRVVAIPVVTVDVVVSI